MSTNRGVVAALMVCSLACSKSGTAEASAPGGGAGGKQRQELIHDPVLDLDAFTVTLPATWHFQGTLVQGTPCSEIPFAVFRASSPDGLTVLERLPRLDWSWSDAPFAPGTTPAGCLPVHAALSGTEFLKLVSAMLQLEYVGETPLPAAMVETEKTKFDAGNAMAAQNAARMHARPFVQRGELAQAKVRFQNGTVPMEGILTATVECTHQPLSSFQGKDYSRDSCSGGVRFLRAPKGKLEEAAALTDPSKVGASMNPAWAQAYMAAQNQRSQQTLHAMQNASAEQLRRSNAQFQQSQQLRQRQHQEFLATMQRGTDMAMHRAAEVANTNHRMASDWVDYALDQQTVRDPKTGQVSKTSSAYSYTWVDSTGRTSFQTNDPSANPNGTLDGSWTRQQVVHGDGT